MVEIVLSHVSLLFLYSILTKYKKNIVQANILLFGIII
jgi:hypothetical protein